MCMDDSVFMCVCVFLKIRSKMLQKKDRVAVDHAFFVSIFVCVCVCVFSLQIRSKIAEKRWFCCVPEVLCICLCVKLCFFCG